LLAYQVKRSIAQSLPQGNTSTCLQATPAAELLGQHWCKKAQLLQPHCYCFNSQLD
jgi:hypothetical protein